jgi:flagellar biosynthetic protein FliR
MVALLAANVALGIMARAFPQMNVFMLSLPVNIGVGFMVLGLSLLVFLHTLEVGFSAFPSQMKALFRLMATG